MSVLSGFAASYVVNAVWEVAVIAGLAWLMSRPLKRLGPQAEHAVWVAALILSVVAPALPVLRMLLESVVGSRMKGNPAAIVLVAGESGAAAHGGGFVLSTLWMWSLLGCYAAILVYFSARLALRIHAAARLLRTARPAALTPQQNEIWRNCEQVFSLKRARILTSAATAGPVALGLRRPILLLPSNFAPTCPPQDFLAALAHECAHLRRRDFQKNLFYEVASLIVAFHPLLGLIKSRIAQTREMICDGMVTEGQIDAGNYARSLLKLAAMIAPRASGNYAVGIFDGNILEQRIMRIRMKKQNVGTAIRYGLILSSAAMLCFTVVGAAALAVPVVTQTGSQDVSQPSAYGRVYKVGKGVSAPVPLNSVVAEYPKSVLINKVPINGKVLIRIIVDAGGMPQDIHVARSFRPDFDAQAVKAVKRYRFKPAMRLGKPVATYITIEVNFRWY